jgi:CHAT domain
MPQTTILILAANPKGTTTLRLDQEVRDITAGLQRAPYREAFNLQSRWAVRPRDLQRALLDLNPQIVHFCGHGLGTPTTPTEPTRKLNSIAAQPTAPEGLTFEDNNGNTTIASTEAISQTFALFKDSIQCVVLNACYSDNQATAIAQHIPYVIGMNQAIGDKAAIEFAISFYDAIGAGRDIPFAYELAKNAIQLAGIPEDLTPVLRLNPLTQQLPAAKPPATPTTTQLTPGQKQRLKQRQTAIQGEWERRSEKLQKIRQRNAIETDAARQFQMDQQIIDEETQLAELAAALDRIEQQL